jgi:rhodanese-related sulfurtransferase
MRVMVKSTCYDTDRAEAYFAQKNAFTTGPVEVSRQIQNKDRIVIIDVRQEEDFRQGHVPGAINLPEERWQTMDGLSSDVPNILYCYSPTCHLASRAAEQFSHEGYAVIEMDGGFQAWKENDLEVEK